jgi:cytochrome c
MNMIKTLPALCCLLLSGFFSNTVSAQDPGAELANDRLCNACHQMNAPSLGPSWQAIAARHTARSDVMVDVLAGKIIRGGGGNWGLVPMVPNQRVTVSEARILSQWILSQTQD